MRTLRIRHFSVQTLVSMLAATLFLAAGVAAAQSTETGETALDRYVHAPDTHFHYDLVKTHTGPGYTSYVLDMTSQQYLTEAEVNHTIWKHWLIVVKPDKVTSNIGLLFIGGGSIARPARGTPTLC